MNMLFMWSKRRCS